MHCTLFRAHPRTGGSRLDIALLCKRWKPRRHDVLLLVGSSLAAPPAAPLGPGSAEREPCTTASIESVSIPTVAAEKKANASMPAFSVVAEKERFGRDGAPRRGVHHRVVILGRQVVRVVCRLELLHSLATASPLPATKKEQL